jgi:hypothetical protein
MQNLFVISIFLEKKILDYMDFVFNDVETESFTYTHFKTYNQNGYEAEAREFIVSGISILLIETNYFHKNMDFEIGITFEKQEEWDRFIDFIKKNESEYGIGEDTEFSYVVTSNENIHSPFFFIFDKTRPLHCNFKVECQLPEKEYLFCTNLLDNYFHSDIEKNIILTAGNDEEYILKKVEVPFDKKIDREIDFSYKNISFEIKEYTFKIMLTENYYL